MVDDLRSGGFGSPFLGYGSRQGGFSQYRIGDRSGEDLAYLDKLAAQTAWQNGQISDDAYLSALREYVKATEKGSSSRISAENQLRDAEYNIGRNELVLQLSSASSARQRLAILTRLIGYDRRWLATMDRDNEQYRETRGRISGLQQQVRETRWGQYVRRYNDDQLSDAKMRVIAQQLARSAAGQPDEQTYRDYITEFGQRILDDKIEDAVMAWRDTHTAGAAKTVRELYAQRMASMSPKSPQHEQYTEALVRFEDEVTTQRRTYEFEVKSSQHAAGLMGDREWLDFMFKRVGEEKPGSVERIRARDAAIAESYDLAEKALTQQVADGVREAGDLIDFLESSLSVMDLDSSRAQELQAQIATLKASGLEALDISGSATGSQAGIPPGMGHYVSPSGAGPGGDGYLSQHDGSDFASKNCGMASAAMLAWDVSGGTVKVNGGDMRYYSGDREGGTWTDDMVRALSVLGIGAREFHGMSFATFRKRIAAGKPAVLTGTTTGLPPALQHGFQGDHSVFVARSQEFGGQTWYWVMDPNGRAGYDGDWWPETALYTYGWQGSFSGSAVFAGKSGNATVDPDRELPPFQAFDTDAYGRSTLTRGGGANRTEAGPRRDWSEGKRIWKLQQAAGGEAAVEALISAVESIERHLSPEQRAALEEADLEVGGADLARTRRAARLLARNDGDARLAVVEWFTGVSPTADTGEWTTTDRWYANAAARKLGLDPITPETVLSPDAPPPASGAAPDQPGVQLDPDLVTLLDPDLDAMAQGLLDRLGVPATLDNVRMVAAWVRAESGDSVEGYNPLKLLTPGQQDLEGQYGRDDSGMAMFESLEAGLDATAAEIRSRPGLLGALRSDDPEAFMRALAAAEWSEDPGYAANVTRTYNTLPGDVPLIARIGLAPFSAPTALSVVARTHPEVAELFDVDTSDPVQLAWFTENMERARQAAIDGAETFTFTPPGATLGDGAIEVPSSVQVGRDIVDLSHDYLIRSMPPGPERATAANQALKDLAELSLEIDMGVVRRHFASTGRDRAEALRVGDYASAFNIGLDQTRLINAVLGQGPDAVPDIGLASPYLDDDDASFLSTRIEALKSDSLMTLYHQGAIKAEFREPITSNGVTYAPGSEGYATSVAVAPEDIFLTLDPDGSIVMHDRFAEPDMFEGVTDLISDGQGGSMIGPVVPAYQSPQHNGGLLKLAAGTTPLYAQTSTYDKPLVRLYRYDHTGRSKELVEHPSMLDPTFGLTNVTDFLSQFNPLDIPYYGTQPDKPRMTMNPAAAYQPTETGGRPVPQMNAAPRTAQPRPEESVLEPMGVHSPGALTHPAITTVQTYDYPSEQTVTWLTLDGVTWLGWLGDRIGQAAPGIVAQNGATWRENPEGPDLPPILVVGDQPYEEAKHGPLGQYLAWYGTGGTKPPPGQRGTGAPNEDYIIKHTALPVGGDVGLGAFEADLALTNTDRLRAGGISFADAMAQRAEMLEWDARHERSTLASPVPAVPTAAQRQVASLAALPGGNASYAATRAAANSARVGAAEVLREEARVRAEAARQAAEQEAARAQARTVTPTVRPRPAPTPTPAPRPEPAPAPKPAPTPEPAPVVTPKPKPVVPPVGTGPTRL